MKTGAAGIMTLHWFEPERTDPLFGIQDTDPLPTHRLAPMHGEIASMTLALRRYNGDEEPLRIALAAIIEYMRERKELLTDMARRVYLDITEGVLEDAVTQSWAETVTNFIELGQAEYDEYKHKADAIVKRRTDAVDAIFRNRILGAPTSAPKADCVKAAHTAMGLKERTKRREGIAKCAQHEDP